MEKVPESAHPISQRPVNFLSLLLVIYPMQLLFSALCSRSLSFQALKKIPHNLESQETNHHRPPHPQSLLYFLLSTSISLFLLSKSPHLALCFSSKLVFCNFFLPECLFRTLLSHLFNLNTSFLQNSPPCSVFPEKSHHFPMSKPLRKLASPLFLSIIFFTTSFSKINLLFDVVHPFPCSPSFFSFLILSLFLCLSIASTTSDAAPLSCHWNFQDCDEPSNRRKKIMGLIPIHTS